MLWQEGGDAVRFSILKKKDRLTEDFCVVMGHTSLYFVRCLRQKILDLLEYIYYLSIVMFTNGFTGSIKAWPFP